MQVLGGRDVRTRLHEEIARNPNDLLIGAAACAWWQRTLRELGHVDADYCKITVCEFPDVGTLLQGRRLSAIGVRVGADPASEVGGDGRHEPWSSAEHARTRRGCQNDFAPL